MSLPHLLVAPLLLLPVPSLTTSQGDDAGSDEVEVRSAAGCPRLFGEERAHEANEARRTRHLHNVRITAERVEIVHSMGRWGEPRRLRMRGLELMGVELPDPDPVSPPSPGDRVAVVEVGEALADLCPPGVYALTVDDALGTSGQVLAIDDRGVLVESAGALAFLPWEGHPLPKRVRMIWRSHYDVVMDASSAPAAGGKNAKAASHKRKRPTKARTKARKKR